MGVSCLQVHSWMSVLSVKVNYTNLATKYCCWHHPAFSKWIFTLSTAPWLLALHLSEVKWKTAHSGGDSFKPGFRHSASRAVWRHFIVFVVPFQNGRLQLHWIVKSAVKKKPVLEAKLFLLHMSIYGNSRKTRNVIFHADILL